MKGLVKWFSNEKGYGFITCSSGQDYYFNVRSVVGANLPSNGDSVEFESKVGNKGLNAVCVKIIEKAEKPTRSNSKQDDRINCPACNKKIVPRMITYRGQPEKSVCPYCAATVRSFGSNVLGYIVIGLVALFIFGIVTG
ncbi:cold-shock DNA-binding domain-containing protein [Vibrio sp. N418]|uniref:cold shock domain-containing protein n=1 Tax=Vibrio sp. (strain N418) TaxID=701176 RepID=UPI00021BD889|nr:cold-shock DNA-binding domain-containing protein [Vibrio sp. N418]